MKSDSRMKRSFVMCAFASCSISFGVIFLMAGIIVIVVSSVSPSSPHRENPFILQSREELNAIPQTISIVLMSIGGTFLLLSIIFMIISLVFHQKSKTISTQKTTNEEIVRNESESEIIKQNNPLVNNHSKEDLKTQTKSEFKGNINDIGLPIRLPHNGFSYTCYPPIYIQNQNQRPYTQNIGRKESRI